MWRRLPYALAFLILLLFPYGPLFPWSPVKPGYTHVSLERADVYYPAGRPLDPAYLRVDEFIRDSEKFHRLPAPLRIRVVECGDWAAFQRFLPQYRSHGIGAVTLATGTVIYMTPRIKERGLDAGEFLRHEISHATLHQNQSLYNAFRIGGVEWLSEGLAVAYGNQKSYYSDAEFAARIRREEVAPFLDPSRRGEVAGIFEIRYSYVVWRRFNEYLMTAKGRVAYQGYLEAVMQDPREWRDLFPKHFGGTTFEDAVRAFQSAAR